jgi:hypothetical protein
MKRLSSGSWVRQICPTISCAVESACQSDPVSRRAACAARRPLRSPWPSRHPRQPGRCHDHPGRAVAVVAGPIHRAGRRMAREIRSQRQQVAIASGLGASNTPATVRPRTMAPAASGDRPKSEAPPVAGAKATAATIATTRTILPIIVSFQNNANLRIKSRSGHRPYKSSGLRRGRQVRTP